MILPIRYHYLSKITPTSNTCYILLIGKLKWEVLTESAFKVNFENNSECVTKRSTQQSSQLLTRGLNVWWVLFYASIFTACAWQRSASVQSPVATGQQAVQQETGIQYFRDMPMCGPLFSISTPIVHSDSLRYATRTTTL